jgi:hypothetical protein
MVGIADLPVEIITGLKSSVQRSALERAEKAKRASTASLSSTTDLSLSKQTTVELTMSETTLATTVDGTDSDSSNGQGVKITEKEVEPSFITPEERAHTISLADVNKPKHTHRIDPGDGCSHKAAVAAEEGVCQILLNTLISS